MILEVKGRVVLIDDEDYEKVKGHKWHINSSGYAVWRGVRDGKKVTIRMHRLINNTPKGMVTDHINHDTLDNRKSNLRSCTQSENMRNLTNQGKGYWFSKPNKNWVVEIYGKHVGCFTTEEEAIEVVELVRSGGTYVKPVRKECKYGHSLSDAYNYGKILYCKVCQSRRSKEYYKRRINMSGTSAGAAKAKAKILAKNPNHFKEIGSKGGKNGAGAGYLGGFAGRPDIARIAGAKGGRISRRGPAKKNTDSN